MSNLAEAIDLSSRAVVLELDRSAPDSSFLTQMRGITEQAGLTSGAIVRAFTRLTLGSGKITFPDFVKLRLFDETFYSSHALRSFVGQRRNRDICVAINFRHDWLGLMANKIASSTYLAAYGLPVVPTAAVYAAGVDARGAHLLRDADALEAFLRRPDIYPLFGKPVESYQSLGSIGLARIDGARGTLIRFDGSAIDVRRLVADIHTHYAAGYLFQPMLAPHRDIAALCGQRLATARIITIATAAGPEVFRACWKIPAGGHAADNYWRPGNLLAQIDPVSGRVLRVTSGNGLSTAEHVMHPDTGMQLVGFEHPHWAGMRKLATDAACLMQHVPLIGWDIACTSDGLVIVEMNETPDFFLAQFADRCGVLDEPFTDFMRFQASRAAAHRRAAAARLRRL